MEKIGEIDMKKNTDEYIKYLEEKIVELESNSESEQKSLNLNNLLKYQEEYLFQKYKEKDDILRENKRLTEENSRLLRMIMLDQSYIYYLLNSYWWKATIPFRTISRKIKNKKKIDKVYLQNITADTEVESLNEKVSIIIFTNNPGNEFVVQIENLQKQKYVNNIEIVVVDRGSSDNVKKICEKAKVKFVELEDKEITDDEAYIKILPNITGDYIVLLEQNKIVDSKYWLYQSLKPLINNEAIATIFFREDMKFLKNDTYYHDLKRRVNYIANEQVLFLPENRDIIQYINPQILDNSSILVKKKISNMFFI